MLTLPFEVDPNSVRAGWLPLLIVVGIGVVLALLYVSMRHELKKISAPTQAELAEQDRQATANPEQASGAAGASTRS